jgi:GntR family transcriptional repressor for pyruvate dehydrogenase complex
MKETLKPIKKDKKTTYEKVESLLRSRILSGELKPGDRLPSERELASLLNVSRASVREAIKMLAAKGLVEVKHGQGIFIKMNEDPDLILQKIDLHLDESFLKEIFEFREAIETMAVDWIVSRASEEEINLLRRHIEETKEIIRERDKGILLALSESDFKFHNLLAKASNNRVLEIVLNSLVRDLYSMTRVKTLKIKGRAIKSIKEHERIVNALEKRDPEEAKKAIRDHIRSVKEDILANL